MSAIVGRAFNFFTSWLPKQASESTPEDTPVEELSKKVKGNITDFIYDGKHKVLSDPLKAVIYSVAIKVIALFVALIFPLLGFLVIGYSIGIIDTPIVLNGKEFTDKLIHSIKEGLIKMRDSFWPNA